MRESCYPGNCMVRFQIYLPFFIVDKHGFDQRNVDVNIVVSSEQKFWGISVFVFVDVSIFVFVSIFVYFFIFSVFYYVFVFIFVVILSIFLCVIFIIVVVIVSIFFWVIFIIFVIISIWMEQGPIKSKKKFQRENRLQSIIAVSLITVNLLEIIKTIISFT